ncbi:hypothetical protein GCM10007938_30460 [Vibrio zhanjiangensis]|uniref:Solute-binding protein family 3/N-terminal domain-containing protein n=1 Tax=Vibrio zhanjiangensis TaxID=1046128 RepID=A0ABQ6F2Q4_9VIBR|nr:hypothetical protein [Vibrio zhanjiangensis]GLT19264.1 hypothetical protein GCM10007938_30460 [Vibrio zhanjiangensis]
MLELKRLPVIALQDTMAQKFIAEQGLTNIKQIRPAIKTKDYFLVLSYQFVERNPQLASDIWQQIEEYRDNVVKRKGQQYFN